MAEQQDNQHRGSFFYTLKGVLWAMLGVRRGAGYDEDVKKISAKQAVIVGLLAVLAFILTLYFVVRLVIGGAAS